MRRLERFEADYDLLCGHLGIENTNRANANVDVEPTELEPGRYKYTPRMNAASIARINRLFSADFDLLGYQRLG